MRLTRTYRLTSFDQALYTLPAFAVKVGGKTYKASAPLGLKVDTAGISVDTLHVGARELYVCGNDAETGHEQYIDTSSRRIRDAHSRWWREQQERLDQTLNRCGVDHVSVATDGDYVRALMTLFARRR